MPHDLIVYSTRGRLLPNLPPAGFYHPQSRISPEIKHSIPYLPIQHAALINLKYEAPY